MTSEVQNKIGQHWRSITLVIRRHIRKTTNPNKINKQASKFFSQPIDKIQSVYNSYRDIYHKMKYKITLGDRNTLTLQESYLLYLAISLLQPSQVIEIGTSQGRSTRMIIDSLNYWGLNSHLVCFDIVDSLKFASHDEVTLILENITGHSRQSVFDKYNPEIIFLDAHPYPLLYNVIAEYLDWSKFHPSLLLIHDCSPTFYSPRMFISKDEPEAISNRTGLWERHVLCEIFKTTSRYIDNFNTNTHQVRIFPTTYGLAMIRPLRLGTNL